MPDELPRLEYLEVTSPRKMAVLSAVRENLKDLHPKDKFYFLSALEGAIQDLKDTAFIEIGMTEQQPPVLSESDNQGRSVENNDER